MTFYEKPCYISSGITSYEFFPIIITLVYKNNKYNKKGLSFVNLKGLLLTCHLLTYQIVEVGLSFQVLLFAPKNNVLSHKNKRL